MYQAFDEKKIGIFTLPRGDMTLSDGVAYTKSLGLSAFEPFAGGEFAMPDRAVAIRLRDAAREANMTLPCLSVLADLGGENREGEADRLIGFARLAAEMGIPMLHHTLIPELDAEKADMSFREALARVVPLARRVSDEAAALGVRCVYEDQGVYFNGCARLGEFLSALERPAGVVLDLGNIAFANEEIEPFARAFADRIVHVHVKDYSLQDAFSPLGYKMTDGRYLTPAVLGEGVMNIRGAIDVLKECHYGGYFMLEHSPILDGAEEQRRCIQSLLSMLRQGAGT